VELNLFVYFNARLAHVRPGILCAPMRTDGFGFNLQRLTGICCPVLCLTECEGASAALFHARGPCEYENSAAHREQDYARYD
jgi:hypothetical protein